MRVLLINTSECAGGAAIAARRLTDALNRHGVKARLLVRDKQTSAVTTARLPRQWLLRLAFLWERLCIFVANGFTRKGLWDVDIANAGADIVSLPEFREADVIHLHWVNQGLLSLSQLGRILESGKPVVWTMHDMWPVTGVCHHARSCTAFHSHCSRCPQLQRPSAHDLSHFTFSRKLKQYARGRIAFVGCSQWITAQARLSALTAGCQVLSIPNTFDADLFCPAPSSAARQRLGLPATGRLLLFACQKVTNPRKGLAYLLDALASPVLNRWQGLLTLVVVGQMTDAVGSNLPFPVIRKGYISSEAEMAALYQAVDLFVTPTLEDNLPNTLMEAMATGTPCVGFDVGGVPEMIVHRQTGYVARFCDALDLAAGIDYVLDGANHDRLSAAAAERAAARWNVDAVVRQYIGLYERTLNIEH